MLSMLSASTPSDVRVLVLRVVDRQSLCRLLVFLALLRVSPPSIPVFSRFEWSQRETRRDERRTAQEQEGAEQKLRYHESDLRDHESELRDQYIDQKP